MIRIERGAEVGPGTYAYSLPAYPGLEGRSKQPLLDACRKLASMGEFAGERAGVFQNGSDEAALSFTISTGAKTTVSEPDKGGGPVFRRYNDFRHET
jgi:hypothetical protein